MVEQQRSWGGRRAIELLYSLLFAVVVTAITNQFAASGWQGITIVVVAVLCLYWVLQVLPKPRLIHALVDDTVRSRNEGDDYRVECFIGFVPLYSDQRPEDKQISSDEKKIALDRLNYEAFDFKRSNFQPTIDALEKYGGHLKHCWLIDTKGKKSGGSHLYTEVFVKYLREKIDGLEDCKFHYGGRYSIEMDDDIFVFEKTYKIVDRVICEARGRCFWIKRLLGLQPQILMNFTTGVRTMMLGMVFAAMNRGVKGVFVGADYDEGGRPMRDSLVVMLFDFMVNGRSLG